MRTVAALPPPHGDPHPTQRDRRRNTRRGPRRSGGEPAGNDQEHDAERRIEPHQEDQRREGPVPGPAPPRAAATSRSHRRPRVARVPGHLAGRRRRGELHAAEEGFARRPLLPSGGSLCRSVRNRFGQVLGGARHTPSSRANAQIPGIPFRPQTSGSECRQPSVCVSVSSGFSGACRPTVSIRVP